MSDIVHIDPNGRRLFAANVGAVRVVFQASTAQQVQEWLTAQFAAQALVSPVPSVPDVVDVGHADRTEVAAWGLTERI